MEIRYLVDGAQKGGLGLFEMKVPAGAHVPPPHSHTNNEECVYMLEGVLRYSVDDEVRDLRPGEWMSTPRGSVHHFSNPGSETARALVMMTPDIGEQYFRDVATLVSAGGPPDRAKLMEVMTRYGLCPPRRRKRCASRTVKPFPKTGLVNARPIRCAELRETLRVHTCHTRALCPSPAPACSRRRGFGFVLISF